MISNEEWDEEEIIEKELDKEIKDNATSMGCDGTNKNKGKYLEIPKDKKAIINMLLRP